jgi:hypothetical protein
MPPALFKMQMASPHPRVMNKQPVVAVWATKVADWTEEMTEIRRGWEEGNVYPADSLSLSWLLFCTTGPGEGTLYAKHSKWVIIGCLKLYIRDACVPTSDLFSFPLNISLFPLERCFAYRSFVIWLCSCSIAYIAQLAFLII